jgi:hypothetical protein
MFLPVGNLRFFRDVGIAFCLEGLEGGRGVRHLRLAVVCGVDERNRWYWLMVWFGLIEGF